MKTNPGGYLDPKEVVGREDIIAQIWRILDGQSIYMNAERRIGKTSILAKLEAEPQAGWRPAKKDLEGIHSVGEFATNVYRAIEGFLTRKKRSVRRVKEFMGSIGGAELGSVLKFPEGKPLPWKDVLEKSIQDLDESFRHDGDRLLFLWDEVPFMIDNIRRREGDEVAMELLDFLRYLRQTYPNSLRMILTGSIGLHHVLSALKGSGYGNAPINDMEAVDVGPLSSSQGKVLAYGLLMGEEIESNALDELATALSASVDHFPYYVHHLVRRLKFSGGPATPSSAENLLVQQLCDPDDPWQLRHYRDRIPTYYGGDAPVVLAILDSIAAAPEPIAAEQIFQEAKSALPFDDFEKLRELLVLLQRDHYVCRTPGGAFQFLFPLIRRWWRSERGL